MKPTQCSAPSASNRPSRRPHGPPRDVPGHLGHVQCYDFNTYDLTYFLKGSLLTASAAPSRTACARRCRQTRIELQPQVYNTGMLRASARSSPRRALALATGLGPTAVGYFIQGWFKFGGVEFFKINLTRSLGEQSAWDNRTGIYLLAAACAEFIADIFLCPLEATRIRLVSQPDFGSGLLDAAPKIVKQDGFIRGFYSGFGPILFKQVPYTMAKFAVQGKAQDVTAKAVGVEVADLTGSSKLAMGLWSGTIAGVAAAIISHPADTLLSLVNKSETAGGTGSIASRLVNLATEMGFKSSASLGSARVAS